MFHHHQIIRYSYADRPLLPQTAFLCGQDAELQEQLVKLKNDLRQASFQRSTLKQELMDAKRQQEMLQQQVLLRIRLVHNRVMQPVSYL